MGRAFGFDGATSWGSYPDIATLCSVLTPTTDVPDDLYRVQLYIDMESEPSENAYYANEVVPLSYQSGLVIGADFVFDFYDE